MNSDFQRSIIQVPQYSNLAEQPDRRHKKAPLVSGASYENSLPLERLDLNSSSRPSPAERDVSRDPE